MKDDGHPATDNPAADSYPEQGVEWVILNRARHFRTTQNMALDTALLIAAIMGVGDAIKFQTEIMELILLRLSSRQK